MRLSSSLSLALVACSAPSKPPIANTNLDGPHVEVVAEIDRVLHWYTVSLAGLHETRAVPLPSSIGKIEWLGSDPVFELEGQRVATITPRGLEIIALPPASTWDRPAPKNPEAQRLDTPETRLFVRDGALWFGHCDWVEQDGLLTLQHWVDARIRPAPVVTETTSDSYPVIEGDIEKPSSPIEPSSSIRVALVPDLARAGSENPPRKKLTCTAHGTTIEDPPVGEVIEDQGDVPDGHAGRDDLIWLSTEPPIFEVNVKDRCVPTCPVMVIFEGCTPSKRFEHVSLGPSQVMGFSQSPDQPEQTHTTWTFLWRGHELGVLHRVIHFGFVPVR